MVVDQIAYICNYSSNVYTKSKKWNSGILKARLNHGSITLFLYEHNEDTNCCGKMIDSLDIFNSSPYSLAGCEFTTSRNIIDVVERFSDYKSKQSCAPAPKARVRSGLQRKGGFVERPSVSAPYTAPAPAITTTPFTYREEVFPKPVAESRFELPAAKIDSPKNPLNIKDVIRNIELMLDDD